MAAFADNQQRRRSDRAYAWSGSDSAASRALTITRSSRLVARALADHAGGRADELARASPDGATLRTNFPATAYHEADSLARELRVSRAQGRWRRPALLLGEGRAGASWASPLASDHKPVTIRSLRGWARSFAPNHRPVCSTTTLQLRVAPPLVVLQLPVPLPFMPLNAPVPPVTLMAILYVASVALVNWKVSLKCP